MALTGLDPLLIIVLKNKGPQDPLGPSSLLDSFLDAVGIPIPIYLSEKLTGIYIDTESKGIDVTTRVDSVVDRGLDGQAEDPKVSQQALDSQLSINMHAKKGSIMLTALLALMDMILSRLVSGEYEIHYLNGPTCIFGAKLHRFGHNSASGSELISMELVLSTASKTKNPTPKASVPAISKVTGAVPL